MTSIALMIVLALAAIWTARRYLSPGSIGLAGVAIAMLGAQAHSSKWAWFVLLLSVILFVIGMLVNRAKGDLFHWGALLVNAFQLLWSALIAIFGWGFWRQTSQVPTVSVALVVIATVGNFVYFIWWLTRRTASTNTN